MMTRVVAAIGALTLALTLAGCRQSDGPVPAPAGEQVNKTSDIARDLLNVASGQAGAPVDLRQDIEGLTAEPPPPHLAESLSARLTEALQGLTLNEQTATKLAGQLFVTVGARELSERQVETLKKDVASTVMQAGAAAERATAVGEVVGEIQTALGTNRRRWWHVG